MKNLLELVNNAITIAPEALMIKEFKAIWNRNKNKDHALQELAYIYHTTDFQSIYRNYHPDTRESKIKLDIFGDREWKEDSTITLAKLKYKELQTTLSMELLNDAEAGISKLRDYFRMQDVDFATDDEGKAAKNFIMNIKQLGDLVKGMKSLREEVEKELADQMQLRGGSTIGKRELPPDRRG